MCLCREGAGCGESRPRSTPRPSAGQGGREHRCVCVCDPRDRTCTRCSRGLPRLGPGPVGQEAAFREAPLGPGWPRTPCRGSLGGKHAAWWGATAQPVSGPAHHRGPSPEGALLGGTRAPQVTGSAGHGVGPPCCPPHLPRTPRPPPGPPPGVTPAWEARTEGLSVLYLQRYCGQYFGFLMFWSHTS